MKKFKSSFAILLGSFMLGLLIPQFAFALPVLKQVLVKNSTEFNVIFDGKVDEKQISTEILNDIYQINFKNVAVYPAKIVPVQGKYFSKIFAYQYSPKLVRLRLTVKGRMNEIKRKLRITPKGESVLVRLDIPQAVEGTDHFTAWAKAPVTEVVPKIDGKKEAQPISPSKEPLKTNEVDEAADSIEEQALLQKVIHATDPASDAKLEKPKTRPEIQEENLASGPIKEFGEPKNLTSGKPLPAILPVMIKLGSVILLVCLLAAGLNRLNKNPKGRHWLKKFGKLAKGGLKNDPPLIEIVSTHHLDPKKSLAVVRIAGRLLVLGVSNEAINLITQLKGEGDEVLDFDLDSEVALGSGSLSDDPIFSDFLKSEKIKPSPKVQGVSSPPDSFSLIPNARSRIKDRLEGLKQL